MSRERKSFTAKQRTDCNIGSRFTGMRSGGGEIVELKDSELPFPTSRKQSPWAWLTGWGYLAPCLAEQWGPEGSGKRAFT